VIYFASQSGQGRHVQARRNGWRTNYSRTYSGGAGFRPEKLNDINLEKIGWGVSRNDNTAAPGNGASAYWTTYRTNFGTIEPYTFFLRRDFVQVFDLSGLLVTSRSLKIGFDREDEIGFAQGQRRAPPHDS
jgi:hypothetical protein